MFNSVDHLQNGVVTYSGSYSGTGEPLHITHIRLNNKFKPKCTLKCRSDEINECLSQNSSDVIDAIRRAIDFLSQIKHDNLLGYKSVIVESYQNWKDIYVIQDADQKSTSAKSVSKTIKWTYEAVGSVIASMVRAVQFLHQNNIVHGHLTNSSIFVNEQNVWKVADYALAAYLHYLGNKNKTSCFVLEKKADLKAIGRLVESFDMQSEALNEFVKLCNTSDDIESLADNPIFRKISKFSRLEAEFDIQSYLGEGAFGDVLEVKSYNDNKDYAIKRVKLPSKTPREFNKAKREAKALSKLRNENIVQYFSSFTEIVDESVFNSYKPLNGNQMDVE